MILRKPYAFLIKYFKLIHLIITVIISYIVYTMNDTLLYINNYFKTSIGKADALNHIHYSIIWLSILSLIIVGFIIWLMRYKNKPRIVYRLYVIGYIYVIIVSILSFKELNSIFVADATLRGIKATIDLLRIATWIQYYFIFCMLIRGLGFDIKRFNFSSDLAEFNIDKQDNEEVEVSFGSGNGKLQRKGRRTLRELKYYYFENKSIIILLITFIILGIIFWIITDRTVTNVVYSEGNSASSGKFTIGVINSYLTNTDNYGNIILDNDDMLVVVKISAKTNSDYKYKINTDYLVLEINGNQFTTTNKYNNYFSDIGPIYKNQYINSNIKNYIVVYRINNKYIKKNMKFKYLGSLDNGKDLEFNINPVGIGNDNVMSIVKLGKELDFSKSILGNTKLTINSYEIKENYNYNYCYLDKCDYSAIIDSLGNNILKLDINSKIDNNIYIEKDWNSIINNYMSIYYDIDEKTYNSAILYSKTPKNMDNNIYIEVDKNIENASRIWLEFNFRNQIYRYILKES